MEAEAAAKAAAEQAEQAERERQAAEIAAAAEQAELERQASEAAAAESRRAAAAEAKAQQVRLAAEQEQEAKAAAEAARQARVAEQEAKAQTAAQAPTPAALDASSASDREIVVNFEKEGKLGIRFDRNSAPFRIAVVSADGLAAAHKELVAGIALHSVQGNPVAALSYEEVLDTIKTAGRPLRLSFIAPESRANSDDDDDSDDAEEEALRRQMNEMVQQRQQQEADRASTDAPGMPGEASDEMDEEAMEDLREDYIMGIMSNCQSCLDPISGERMLVADLSYTVRRLSVAERFNLRNENELSDSSEDNQLFERRSSTTLAERSLSGSTGGLGRDDEGDQTKDGATVLLTADKEFSHVVVLGAPACGKTTLLQKMRYWAAISAYQEPEQHPIPVFVYLVGFAKFIMQGGPCDLLAYLKSSTPPDQYKVIAHAHAEKTSLYLLDGLDECASVKAQLQQYIGTTLAAETGRVVLSSRLAGFSDDSLAEAYEFVQLELCSVEIQKKTAKARLGDTEYASFEEMMSENPMFALYATTPLSLSLLIELFKHKKLVNPRDPRTGRQRTMNRGEIYRAGMLHMMDVGTRLQKYTTDECANAFIEANDFPRLDYSYNEEVWRFFGVLSLDLHQRGTRNFKVRDVRRLGFGELWARLFPYLRAYIMPMFNRLDYELEAVDVQRAEAEAPVPTFSSKQAERDGDHRYTWRFIHLTFQEFFVAQELLYQLDIKLKNKGYFTYANDVVNGVLQGKLYDSWYRESILLMSSCAPDQVLSSIIDYLMAQEDNTGVNEHLVMVILDERRDHPLAHTVALKVRQQQEARVLSSVVAALGHPFSELRTQAIEQLQHLGLSVSRIADKVVAALTNPETNQPWFRLKALMESLVELRSDGVSKLSQADTTLAETIKDSLLVNSDLDVVSAAATALGALGVRNGRLVFALFDVMDQGHRDIVRDVAHAATKLGVPWPEICTQLMHRLEHAETGGAGGAVMLNSAEIAKSSDDLYGSSPLGGRSPSKLANFKGTDSSVHRLGEKVEEDDVNAEWIEVAKTLASAGPEHLGEVMDSLQAIMTNQAEDVAVAGAKGFGQVGLMHYVMEWSFEQLEDVNPAFQRQRGLQCLAAVAEDFPSMQAIEALCSYIKDPDPGVGRIASKAIPTVAKALLVDAPASVGDTLLSSMMELMAETAVNPDMHLLASEALIELPGSAGMSDPNTEQVCWDACARQFAVLLQLLCPVC